MNGVIVIGIFCKLKQLVYQIETVFLFEDKQKDHALSDRMCFALSQFEGKVCQRILSMKGISSKLAENILGLKIRLHIIISQFDLLKSSRRSLLLDLALRPMQKYRLLLVRIIKNQICHVVHV